MSCVNYTLYAFKCARVYGRAFFPYNEKCRAKQEISLMTFIQKTRKRSLLIENKHFCSLANQLRWNSFLKIICYMELIVLATLIPKSLLQLLWVYRWHSKSQNHFNTKAWKEGRNCIFTKKKKQQRKCDTNLKATFQLVQQTVCKKKKTRRYNLSRQLSTNKKKQKIRRGKISTLAELFK